MVIAACTSRHQAIACSYYCKVSCMVVKSPAFSQLPGPAIIFTLLFFFLFLFLFFLFLSRWFSFEKTPKCVGPQDKPRGHSPGRPLACLVLIIIKPYHHFPVTLCATGGGGFRRLHHCGTIEGSRFWEDSHHTVTSVDVDGRVLQSPHLLK